MYNITLTKDNTWYLSVAGSITDRISSAMPVSDEDLSAFVAECGRMYPDFIINWFPIQHPSEEIEKAIDNLCTM